ncbi:MAG: tryptophan 7-halogenase [Solirubrobacteraceae bacterium]
METTRHDVVILGGGLAGLTLALQLKRRRPETDILVIESRAGAAPDAAFKVGESTVEISAHYFADVVGLRDHLENDQLHKFGLRFYLTVGDNSDVTRRVEFAPTLKPPADTFQIDRGRFENEIRRRAEAAGVEVLDGASVSDVDLGDELHTVHAQRGSETLTATGRWVVDASGRASLLKRKLGLAKESGHHINASWIRLDGGLDHEKWGADNEAWMSRMPESGLRMYSTTHLMGRGYWVWMIPLVSGPISIGICADPRVHPYEQINTRDAFIEWLLEHEHQLGAEIDGRRDQIVDFLRVEDFSYNCKRMLSPERWALTGEAAAFADPLYSPGSDFISYANTWIDDVIVRDLSGEPWDEVEDRLELYNFIYSRMFTGQIGAYRNMYPMFGSSQAMLAKLAFNAFTFFSLFGLAFTQDRLTDLDFVAFVSDIFEVAGPLMGQMEDLFRRWAELDDRELEQGALLINEWPVHRERNLDLVREWSDEGLRERFTDNLRLMQAMAILMWYRATRVLPDGPPVDEDTPVNPAAVSLTLSRWEKDGLVGHGGMTVREAGELIPEIERVWLDEATAPIGT